MEGWIKMHRKFLEWEWYSDINVKCVMIHLLLKANHKDGRWRGIEIKRGSCITGIFALCEELKMSKSKINTALKKLKSSGEIGIKTTNKYSMISITNYVSFQSNEKQIGNKSETNRKQIGTNKNEKNKKNEKKKSELPKNLNELGEYVKGGDIVLLWNIMAKSADMMPVKSITKVLEPLLDKALEEIETTTEWKNIIRQVPQDSWRKNIAFNGNGIDLKYLLRSSRYISILEEMESNKMREENIKQKLES